MRYFACLFVGLCICASVLDAAEPNSGQLSTSEKQLADKQGTQNPEAYALYLKGRSYWSKRTLSDLETAAGEEPYVEAVNQQRDLWLGATA
jgi:hypothetical protein